MNFDMLAAIERKLDILRSEWKYEYAFRIVIVNRTVHLERYNLIDDKYMLVALWTDWIGFEAWVKS